MAIKPVGYAIKTALEPRMPMLAKPKLPKAPAPNALRTFASDAGDRAGMRLPIAPMPGAASVTPDTTAPPDVDNPAGVPFNFGAYLGEVNNYPTVKLAVGNYNTNLNSWRRQLESAIRSGVVQGGWDVQGEVAKDPLLSQYLNNYISPEMWAEITAAAAGNPTSDKAMLERQLRRETAANAYEQAARGTVLSGAHAVANTNTLDENVLARNAAMNQLLTALRGGVTTFLGQQQQGEREVAQARAEATALLAAQEGAAYDTAQRTEAQEGAGQVDVPGAPGLPSAAGTLGGLGVPWGGQLFLTKQALAAYLKKQGKGVTYAQWAANHPDAALRLR